MTAVSVIAVAYVAALVFGWSLARAAARGDRPHDQALASDWWAEFDAQPLTGVCATCRKPVTRRALFCDAACQMAWEQSS